MNFQPPANMRAVAIDRFGSIDTLKQVTLPTPTPAPDQLLVRVAAAGVGTWDKFEREGYFAGMCANAPSFPYVLGSEGAGTVVATGGNAGSHGRGDKVFGLIPARNPKGGFYADYAVVDADKAWSIPSHLLLEQAATLASNGGTALRGLRDKIRLMPGETVLIFGAGGGMGHLAVQLAKAMGARVIAVASGEDGTALASRLGADVAFNGRDESFKRRLSEVLPNGLDAALVTGGADASASALVHLRPQSRVAVPNGVYPPPQLPHGIQPIYFNGDYDDELLTTLRTLAEAIRLEVHLSHRFSLTAAADAHRTLEEHYLGRIVLVVG
jgi:NADPH2:quinone reductase